MSDQDHPPAPAQPQSRRLNVLPAHSDLNAGDVPVGRGRFPAWLHRRLPRGNGGRQTAQILSQQHLHTVCEEAKCPNLPECWSRKTATFLVMGKACTRSCGFCAIEFSAHPPPLEDDEPQRVAASVNRLNLKHVVITMVARDDLPDGGSAHLARVMSAVRHDNPGVTVELLTSDFAGQIQAWQTILEAAPDIFNHNIETVRALTPRVRHKATYDRTLQLLQYAASHRPSQRVKIKSGFMVGLGETDQQVYQTLEDLKRVGCEIVTIGQYLQSDHRKLRVKAFITPQQFKQYETFGYEIGLPYVYAQPFVRSSYNADSVLKAVSH